MEKSCGGCKVNIGWYELKFIDYDTGKDMGCSTTQPVPPSVGDYVNVFGWCEVMHRQFDYTRGTYAMILVRPVKD